MKTSLASDRRPAAHSPLHVLLSIAMLGTAANAQAAGASVTFPAFGRPAPVQALS